MSTLYSYIVKGGPIMYILVVLNIIGYSIMIWKLIQFLAVGKRGVQSLTESIVNAVRSKGVPLKDEHVILALLKDEMNAALYKVESGLNTVKIIATISPLLGLLGTVLGILSAFTAISKQGLSDPSQFAGGISLALITTVGGLIVAIPHNIGYNYLLRMVGRIEVRLEERLFPSLFQSEGLRE